MDISRITKAITTIRGASRFEDAEKVRHIDLDVILPAEISVDTRRLAKTVTALALRSLTGQIRFHHTHQDSVLVNMVGDEALKMGMPQRLEFNPGQAGRWRLCIGCENAGGISVDVSGWTARVNGAFEKRLPAAPPAIAFAVACAFAKIFSAAVLRRDHNLHESWAFCVLRFLPGDWPPIEYQSELDFGRFGLLGAGAIGSALGYVLRMSSWTGQLDIIDPQYFEYPNLETCISADVTAANRPLHKATSLARFFKGHGIIARERIAKITVDSPILTEKWNGFICAVDNSETRRILDRVNADILLNAGVGGDELDAGWVLWSRHKAGLSSLATLYQEIPEGHRTSSKHVPEEFKDECSRMHYEGVSLALPFVGLAAGSFLASSLYQHVLGAEAECSQLRIDLLAKQQKLDLE